jgi:SAM-dependent methyltransferase
MRLDNDPPRFKPESTNISQAAPSLLRTLFLHHDGIVVGATIGALQRHRLLDHLFQAKRLAMRELLERFPCNAGYLHVALRCLALQGWLRRAGAPGSEAMTFEVTPLGEWASAHFPRYTEVAALVYSDVSMEQRLFHEAELDTAGIESYAGLVEDCRNGWGLRREGLPEQQGKLLDIVDAHLSGMLTGPLMIALKMRGLLEGDYFPMEEIPEPRQNLKTGLTLLEHLGWVVREGTRYRFTEVGRVACEFTLHYGLTLSYLPMYRRLPELIFHSAGHVTHVQQGQEETHVDRVLNVLASGVAHRPYFEDSDAIITGIFNREPLEEQPRFVADMGCGDAIWLKRIYGVVRTKTLRGRHLDQHPLLMVAADYNVKALEVARRTLDAAGVPHIALFGDVTDPAQFAAALAERGMDIGDGLHIRAFIDHNRRYTPPEDSLAADPRPILSTGAYADQDGNAIPNNHLEQSLIEHLRRWVPYINRHGVIIIEAHNVCPDIAARYNGKTHATAFDTYHGYSNQYPLDFEAFMRLADEAGLNAVPYEQRLYPSRPPFVAISLSRFKAEGSAALLLGEERGLRRHPLSWQPDGAEDAVDGEALHRFLYENGDINRPRRWCFSSTGVLVRMLLEAVEARLEHNKNGAITLVDYGAGTGLATLELIKGLHETGLLEQLRLNGIELRLKLFDFSSGWFAKAYELLHAVPFAEFYSLKDPGTGKIRLLSEIVEPGSVDILFASMVLHLVPPKALPALIESFAEAMKPGGDFIWNSPDTGPVQPYTEVIHAANRALRKAVLAVLADGAYLEEVLARVHAKEHARYADLPYQVSEARRALTPERMALGQIRADKQVLPVPTGLGAITQLIRERFSGVSSSLISVLSREDALALALLPANQRYFNEIEDPDVRCRLVRLLLEYEVLPRLCAHAGNPLGLNLLWIYGRYRKIA